MEANRKTRYAWMAVGALTCLLGLAAMTRLWDVGKAHGQAEPPKPDPTKTAKAAPPAPLPSLSPDEPPLADPPKLEVIQPVKAVLPPPPPGLPGVDVPAPPTGSEERPIIIPGKPTPPEPKPPEPKKPTAPPKMVPVKPHGDPLPPISPPKPSAPPPSIPPLVEQLPGSPTVPSPLPTSPPPTIEVVPPAKHKVKTVAAVMYRIRTNGMTVRTLALETLGRTDRYPEICALNPLLTETTVLRVGTTVSLPADAVVHASTVTPLPMLRARPKPEPKAVLPLTGTFPMQMDAKGNLVLPPAVMAQLGKCSTVLISPGSDRCLWLTNQAHLDRLSKKLDRSPAPESDVRSFKRLYYAQTVKVALRGEKAHVSNRLAAFAGLSQDVVLVGIDDHFEVWDAEKWRKYTLAKKASLDRE